MSNPSKYWLYLSFTAFSQSLSTSWRERLFTLAELFLLLFLKCCVFFFDFVNTMENLHVGIKNLCYLITDNFLTCAMCKNLFHESYLPLKTNNTLLCRDCDVAIKINSMQKEALRLKQEINILHNPFSLDAIVNEMSNRIKRAKNLIVYNMPESRQQIEGIRKQEDRFQIITEISKFCMIDLTRIHVQRIGYDIANGPRPLKVFLKAENDVRTVMRNRRQCNSGLRFTRDKSVNQRRKVEKAHDDVRFLRQEEMPVVAELEPNENIALPQPEIEDDDEENYDEPLVESGEEFK